MTIQDAGQKNCEVMTKETWIKGQLAVGVYGEFVPSRSSQAVGWCLGGWVFRCYNDQDYPTILHRIEERLGAGTGIGTWNDDPLTTYEMVHQLVKELDI